MVWKEVPGFEGRYEVSDLGEIRNTETGIELKGYINTNGYPRVVLRRNGKSVPRYIHQLVALAFLGEPPEGKPNVLHWDDNPENNRVENLRWGDQRENGKDWVRNHGGHFNSKKTHCAQGHPFDEYNTRVTVTETGVEHRVCKACMSKRVRAFNKAAKGAEPPEHGTMYAYSTFKCRCDTCREFMRGYSKAYREKNRERINAKKREAYARKKAASQGD